MGVSPEMLINQPSQCGNLLMPCWHIVVQRYCEQLVEHAYIPVQQGHKSCDNILQSLPYQPLACNKILLMHHS